jgi:hypothetical protein
VRVALRLPQERLERRFRGEESVAAVFAFVDEKMKSEGVQYKLVSAYPRVVYHRSDNKTMTQVGSTTLLYEEEEE